MPIVHSYSALKLYEQCGLRYYRQRILKDAHETDTSQITYGNSIHKAIENNIQRGTPIPPELDSCSGAASAVKKAAQSVNKKVKVETNLGVDKDFNPADYWGNDVWLRAKIDVTVTGGPEAAILDWKTGNRKVDFTQLKIASLVLLKTDVNIYSVSAGFVWLKDGILDRETYGRVDIPNLIADIKPRLEAIEEAQVTNVWKPKPSYLCKYCPCKPTCSYALK